MREEIIKMAQEAGMRKGWDGWTTGDDPNCMYPECVYTENLERFFHMAQAAEREACAKLADEKLMDTSTLLSMPPKSSAAWSIAAAIRARGQA